MATIDPFVHVMTSAANHAKTQRNDTDMKANEMAGAFECMDFELDDQIQNRIEEAATQLEKRMQNYICQMVTFPDFGQLAIVDTLKTHPDAFVQLAIQIAVFKTHQKYWRLSFIKFKNCLPFKTYSSPIKYFNGA